jgi:hypothetical protein
MIRQKEKWCQGDLEEDFEAGTRNKLPETLLLLLKLATSPRASHLTCAILFP